MKTSVQVKIDQLLVKPIVSMLNVLVRIVGKLLRIDHSLDRKFERIAVCKFKGMGSIINAIPMLHGLRNTYPNGRIVFVSTKGNAAFLQQLHPLIDQSICLDDGSLWRLIKSGPIFMWHLIKSRFQLYIDLEIYSDTASLITTLSLATNRFGYYLRSSQYRKGVYTHLVYFNDSTPITEVYKQMARICGITDFEANTPIVLDQRKDVEFDKPYIVINPNASDLKLERRWSAKNFVSLINKLLKQSNYSLLIIGAPSEKEYINTLLPDINPSPRLTNLAGQTTMEGLLDIIAGAALVITNDSGPMHISFYFNKPTIALFGPCDPYHYGIERSNVYMHYAFTYCSPCVHKFEVAPCHGNNVCMQLITLDQVWSSFQQWDNGKPSTFVRLPIVYTQVTTLLSRSPSP